MFQSKEYVTASRARTWFSLWNLKREQLDELAQDVKLKQAINVTRTSGKIVDKEKLSEEVKDKPVPQRLMGKRRELAFASFLRMSDLFILSPAGVVQPINHDILESRGRREDGEPNYYFLSPKYLMLDISALLTTIEAAQTLRERGNPSLLTFSTVEALDSLIVYGPVAKSLVPFEGWSLAVRRKAPTEKELLQFYDLLHDDEPTAGLPPTGPGRPRKKERAVEAYLDRFPNGHNGYTWPEVLRILEVEYDVAVGEETLRTGLREARNAE